MRDIVNEIRRMQLDFHEKHGYRGEAICLDANTEARLAVYMACDFDLNNKVSVDEKEKSTRDIMENRIRHLNPIICGMKVKFDCPSFCIESTGNIV